MSYRRSRTEPDWADLPSDELLDVRICDLGVKIEGSVVEDRIGQLYEELETRGIGFRPHFWLSDDWFSPDGIPGVAIPFYMSHPRLIRLERSQMLQVEGGSKEWCMRILRHEAGHTLDTAFRLHRRQRWRELFGSATEPYPEYYQPKPYSKSYVFHLESWYAQSHPCEDFAETFAVWLRPRSRWRSNYAGWPAIKKLHYVNDLMAEICDAKPAVRSREFVDPVRKIRKTLRQHYQEKRDRYDIGGESYYDRELRQLFSDEPEHEDQPSAAGFLRQHRSDLRNVVAKWTGQYPYTIDQVLKEMVDRCRDLKLRLQDSEDATLNNALVMLTAQTMNYLHSGRHKVAL